MSNLSPEIERNIAQSESDGGVWMKDVPIEGKLEVQTRNTLYKIERRGEDDWWIEGHQKYCPVPTKCTISGSTWGGSMLKIEFIGRGMHLEFCTDAHHRITTTEMQEVTMVEPVEEELQSLRNDVMRLKSALGAARNSIMPLQRIETMADAMGAPAEIIHAYRTLEAQLAAKHARIVELDKACLLEEEAKSYYRNLLYVAETKLAESNARIAEMERRDLEAVTNCDKLKVARETRKHWQERAESAEAKLRSVSEVLKEIPVVAQYEFHEGWLECYSIASVDFFVARLRSIVEEGK